MAKKSKKDETPAERRERKNKERLVNDPTFPIFNKEVHDPVGGDSPCYTDRVREDQPDNPDAVPKAEADILSDRMNNYATTDRTIPFAIHGIDAQVMGHVLRQTLNEYESRAKALRFSILLFRQTRGANIDGSEPGKMCDKECDKHDTPEECDAEADEVELQMLEELHETRVSWKRISDLYNSYVQQIRGFCRGLPPLLSERPKGPKIEKPTPEIMDNLFSELSQYGGLSEEDKK